MKNKIFKLVVVSIALLAVFSPEISYAGEGLMSDSAIGNAMDTYTKWISDIPNKTLAVYKPFMGAAATVMGGRFVYKRAMGG